MGVASDPFGTPQGDVDPLDDMGIRGGDTLSLSHNWGKIKAAPAGAPTPLPGPDYTPCPAKTRGGAADMSISMPRSSPHNEGPVSQDEARPYIVDMLDSIRRQQAALDINRPRFMLLARRYGLKHREIAELLGMTEAGVRQAVHRAKNAPGMEFGGAA